MTFESSPSATAIPLTNWVLPTPRSPSSARTRGNLANRFMCLLMRALAKEIVASTEVVVVSFDREGMVRAPWRKTMGSLRVVSTTVLVGRSASLPPSRNIVTISCLTGSVYFCQSANEYGSFLPLVLAEVAVMGLPYAFINERAKSCLGMRIPRPPDSDSSRTSSTCLLTEITVMGPGRKLW